MKKGKYIILSMIIIFLSYFFISTYLIGSSSMDKYLKSNHQFIDLNEYDGYQGLSILEGDLANKDIFLSGENHAIKANYSMQIKLLKYLKEKVDLKYLLCEISYSSAYFLNEYLKSGDKNILDKLFDTYKGTPAWSRDGYSFWEDLYKYNINLPQDKKISVVGVDIEHQPQNAFEYMRVILKNKRIPNSITVTNELNDLVKLDNKIGYENLKKACVRFCESLKTDMENNSGIYKQSLGEEFDGFNLVNNNILNMFKAYDAEKSDGSIGFNNERDNMMSENFIYVYSKLPRGKYYGQFGINHVFQKENADIKWFASLINKKCPEIKDRVLSIVYLYKDSLMLGYDGHSYVMSAINTYDYQNNIFKNILLEDCTIIKLNNKNSPFSKQLIWPLYGEGIFMKPEKGVTTDYFQYVIIIKNSKAVDKLM